MKREVERSPYVVTAKHNVHINGKLLVEEFQDTFQLTEHQAKTLAKSGHTVNTPEKQAALEQVEAEAEAAKAKVLEEADDKSKASKSKSK